jgi:hypothetical protein
LSGAGELPAAVLLRLAHPTRAGMDERVTLRAVGPGLFEGRFANAIYGRRLILLEDAAHTWRQNAEAGNMAGDAIVLSVGELQ